MSLLINRTDLELLLEKKKDKIGHDHIEGLDTLFSGVTFLISTVFASYQDIGVVSEPAIKTICFVLGAAFSVRGIYMIVMSQLRKYGHRALLRDIEDLNEVTHPFSIIAIKDTFLEYPNRFLLYYDTRWDCSFFLYYRTDNGGEAENRQNICARLSSELKIPADEIKIEFIEQRIQRKYSESDKRCKCYEHRVYQVEIPFTDTLKKDHFEIDGKDYCWMTLSDMENDEEIQKKNLDVVSFVRETIV